MRTEQAEAEIGATAVDLESQSVEQTLREGVAILIYLKGAWMRHMKKLKLIGVVAGVLSVVYGFAGDTIKTYVGIQVAEAKKTTKDDDQDQDIIDLKKFSRITTENQNQMKRDILGLQKDQTAGFKAMENRFTDLKDFIRSQR